MSLEPDDSDDFDELMPPHGTKERTVAPIAPTPGTQVEKLQLVATAIHEAGHAVMAILLGRSIQKVTIAPGKLISGDTRLGICEMKKGRRASKDAVEDDVLILLAGMVAEARFTGQYCHAGASQDLRAVKRLLQNRGGSDRQLARLQRRMLDKTEYLLDDEGNARAVQSVARELLLRTTISGRAVRHLFDEAT